MVTALTHPSEEGHQFYVIREGNGCVVASVNVVVGDWAAYRGGSSEWYEVRKHGDKLAAEAAGKIFPEIAAKFQYRR